MQQNKVLSLLGLATKAGKIVSGAFSVEKAVKENKTYLVIVAEDASMNTRKKFTNMCEYYRVPICFFSTKDQLGHCIGKEFRSVAAVMDKGFSDAIGKQLTN